MTKPSGPTLWKWQWEDAVLDDPELRHSTKVVAAHLRRLMKPNGLVHVSRANLARRCGLTPTSISAAIKELRDRGYLITWRTNRTDANWYRLLLAGEPLDATARPSSTASTLDVDEGKSPYRRVSDFDDKSASLDGKPACPPTISQLEELSGSLSGSNDPGAGERARPEGPRSPARRPAFCVGDLVRHPRDGDGTVKVVEPDDRYPGAPYLTVEFESGERRLLGSLVRRMEPRP